MGLSLPKSNLIFLKKCLDKWVHFTEYKLQLPDKAVLQKKLQELVNMPLIEE